LAAHVEIGIELAGQEVGRTVRGCRNGSVRNRDVHIVAETHLNRSSSLIGRPVRPGARPSESRSVLGTNAPTGSTDWRQGLPTLISARYTLREVRAEDAPSLLAHLNTEEVSRFIAAPPSSVEAFETYIDKAHRDRESGQHVWFAVVPTGADAAVGVFQLRSLEAGFATAEWGFAIGSAYWGSGLFVECARLVLAFAFETLGVLRLEARAAVMNGLGNGALRKVGAVQEGVLRGAFQRQGERHDQVLWSILAEEWFLQQSVRSNRIH